MGTLYACDLAICADEAKFGLSEINWGILPAAAPRRGCGRVGG
jgi:enoyl-CoA hydratase/carnithine racemase